MHGTPKLLSYLEVIHGSDSTWYPHVERWTEMASNETWGRKAHGLKHRSIWSSAEENYHVISFPQADYLQVIDNPSYRLISGAAHGTAQKNVLIDHSMM